MTMYTESDESPRGPVGNSCMNCATCQLYTILQLIHGRTVAKLILPYLVPLPYSEDIWAHPSCICSVKCSKVTVYCSVIPLIEARFMGLWDSLNCFTNFTQPPYSVTACLACSRFCLHLIPWGIAHSQMHVKQHIRRKNICGAFWPTGQLVVCCSSFRRLAGMWCVRS